MAYESHKRLYNIADYGVVATSYSVGSCDTSKAADNKTAIDALIALIAATPEKMGTIYIPPTRNESHAFYYTGTIDLTATLTCDINLLGEGSGESILIQYDAAGTGASKGLLYTGFGGSRGTRLQGFQLVRFVSSYNETPPAFIAENYGIFNVIGYDCVHLEDIYTQGWAGAGYYIGGNTGPGTFVNCSAILCGYGLMVGPGLSGTAPYNPNLAVFTADISWTGGTLRASMGGIRLYGGTSNSFRDIDMELSSYGKYPVIYGSPGGAGYYAGGSISGCTFDNCTATTDAVLTPNAAIYFDAAAGSCNGNVIIGGHMGSTTADVPGIVFDGTSAKNNVVIGGFWEGHNVVGATSSYYARSINGANNNTFISPAMVYYTGRNKVDDTLSSGNVGIGVNTSSILINGTGIANNFVNMAGLPTASTGLVTGTVWNNGGVLNIIP